MSTAPNTTQQLLDPATNAYGLRLTLEQNGLICCAAIETRTGLEPISFTVLRSFLNQLNITRPDTEAMSVFIQKTKEAGTASTKTVIAKGVEPTTGADAYFDLSFEPSTPGFLKADLFDRVDQRSVQAFDNVVAGDLIGTFHPPQAGKTGTTVDGKVIPGLLGKPMNHKVGKGVRVDEESGHYYASIDGRVVRSDTSIDVTEDYEVFGNVDFRIGHINFNGKVKISGHVLDGFNLRATDDITIGGDAGRSRIESDGNITLNCMAGHGSGVIRCGGTLTADTLIDAEIECLGDVIVHSEVRNCTIRTRGKIRVSGGQIQGGECLSLGGIECAVAGCESGLTTRLSAGVDYQIEDQKKQVWKDLNSCDDQLANVSRVIHTLQKRIDADAPEPPNLKQLKARKKELMENKHGYTDQLDRLTQQPIDHANGKINIEATLYEGVVLTIESVETRITKTRQGALSLIENVDGQTLKTLSLSPLELSAEQLREEFVLD